ncbi:DUF4163 domain-containing protein [Sphingobium sp. AP49]|uniref:DUF4163 domain-containing protein n=1 Tax=Sphingobium sp. AP49 TaxID=1144307 RepID=UPI00026ECF98|nr:DUF4163 domain-containing protein [Sphingobium sp. AP49]WHO40541.1 DUF4163 domain-containing protein [Sphingobium sp. AP49]
MQAKRGIGATGLLLAALFLSGCSQSNEEDGSGGNMPANAAVRAFADRMAGTPPPARPAKPFDHSEKTDLLEFVYTYPAQAAAVPALVDRFSKAMAEAKADALKMAGEDRKSAKQSGFPFHPHSRETRWSVMADTPRFLALESSNYMFTGGAHGMTGYEALLWDKERRRETDFGALLTSEAAFAAAIHDPFCKALDRERTKKRGAPVPPGDDDFSKCIDPMKQVLAPTSRDGKLIDGIQVTIGPYGAGPYAEGSYDIKLPVDAAIYKVIKTEYQDAFAKP